MIANGTRNHSVGMRSQIARGSVTTMATRASATPDDGAPLASTDHHQRRRAQRLQAPRRAVGRGAVRERSDAQLVEARLRRLDERQTHGADGAVEPALLAAGARIVG